MSFIQNKLNAINSIDNTIRANKELIKILEKTKIDIINSKIGKK